MSNMVKIRCYTNLDINEQWPEKLPCRPVVDDIMTSDRGLELRVVQVKFPKAPKRNMVESYRRGIHGLSQDEIDEEMTIHVELHLVPNRHENINEFNKWYERWMPKAQVAKFKDEMCETTTYGMNGGCQRLKLQNLKMKCVKLQHKEKNHGKTGY
ncbi:MAG: hypothetical protein WC375_00330 [Methanomassiliicoccales archaeon]